VEQSGSLGFRLGDRQCNVAYTDKHEIASGYCLSGRSPQRWLKNEELSKVGSVLYGSNNALSGKLERLLKDEGLSEH